MSNVVTHHAVQAAISASAAQAAEMNVQCTIAVCDAGGHLLGLLRAQGALLASLESAQNKARTAVYFGVETRHLPSAQPIVPALLGAVSYPLAFLPGGVPIRAGRSIVAGVGVGGGSADEDQALATFFANALIELIEVA